MRFFSELWRVSIVFCLLLFAHAAPLGAATISDIIENVRKNEALYQNLDVILATHYSIGDREPARMSHGDNKGDTETLETSLRTHYIGQNGLFRLEIEGATNSDQNSYSRDRIRAFDGATTRLYDQKAIGNVIPGRSEDPNFVRPHMLLLRMLNYGFSLSTYLSGDDGLLADPSASAWWPGTNCRLEVTYQGNGAYRGIACQKVWVTTIHNSFGPYSRWEIWLAEDRNYLPVRIVSYGFKFSKDIPDGESEVTDLREISPGIWFPFAAEDVCYNQMILQREGRQVLQWRQTYVTERATLDPAYDESYFRDVTFPPGTAVYELAADSKIVRSYRDDAPGTETDASIEATLGRQWLLWLNVSILAGAALVISIRRWFARRGVLAISHERRERVVL